MKIRQAQSDLGKGRVMAGGTRYMLFLSSILASLFVFYSPIAEVAVLSFQDALYSHIPLIPLLSAFLLFHRRKAIFAQIEYSFVTGVAVVAAGASFYAAGFLAVAKADHHDHLSILTLSALTVWIGIFILFYGFRTFRNGVFPLLFLFIIVPLPNAVVGTIQDVLQKGSAETVHAIFYLLGLHVTREGYLFHFPGLTVEILQSCTGIRASIALFITSIVASNLFLSKGWTRTLAVVLSLPITILKNSFRIAALTIIGVYVDEGVFLSHLHNTAGGILFFLVALFLLWVAIRILAKSEKEGG